MNKKEIQYCNKFFLTLIGGAILVIPSILGVIILSPDNSYGKYGAAEADALTVMIIVTAIAILSWFIGLSHYLERWRIATENKQISYKCEKCNKIIMIPEIETIEEKEDHYLKCPICNNTIWRV